MFPLFLLGVLAEQNEPAIAALPDDGKSTSLGLQLGSECTTSSENEDFSDCHPAEVSRHKALFVANAGAVIAIGAPANLLTLLALPYVRLRWAFLIFNIGHFKDTTQVPW